LNAEEPSIVVLLDGSTDTRTANGPSTPSVDGKDLKTPKASFSNRKKWIIGIAVFVLLAISTTLVCYFTLGKSSMESSRPNGTGTGTTPPKRTNPPTSYTVSTFAGSGVKGYQDGPVADAQFDFPRGIAVDPRTGDIIVVDTINPRIRRISNGIVTTIAGTGIQGYQDGPASTAQFNTPHAVTVHNGELFVSDYFNERIRGISNGIVRTVAGTGVNGYRDGPASDSLWSEAKGITTNSNGDIYVADGPTIRMIRGSTVSTFTGANSTSSTSRDGTGIEARFRSVDDVAFDRNGNLIVADTTASQIRRVTPSGVVTTLSTNFNSPSAVCVDQFDTIYVVESTNHRIYGLAANGTKFLVAGTGSTGNMNGAGATASFNRLGGIAIDSKGVLYVADSRNDVIRMITPVWN
jgi:sugar lactone lactonase YvrE